MAKRLTVPPSLQHLIEKREVSERRKNSATSAKPVQERRSSQRRGKKS